jgi:hypothetical protein
MPTDQLLTIQRINVVLGIAATAVGGLIWGVRGMFAAAAGAALAVANFWVIRRLGSRAVARVTEGSLPRALPLVGALMLKMAILFGLVWFMIRRVGLPVLPFTLGMSVFVAAILIAGFSVGGRGPDLAASSDEG